MLTPASHEVTVQRVAHPEPPMETAGENPCDIAGAVDASAEARDWIATGTQAGWTTRRGISAPDAGFSSPRSTSGYKSTSPDPLTSPPNREETLLIP
jgi:hypothetical protein